MSANITIAGFSPDLVSAQSGIRISGLKAGETLTEGQIVYIASDGTAMKAVSTQCSPSNRAEFAGMVVHGAVAGEPVTIFGRGCRMKVVESGLTIGQLLWVSGTAGALYNAKVASADVPAAICVTSTDIVLLRP
jgi:hypothetical protein